MKVHQEVNVLGGELRMPLYAKISVSSDHCVGFEEQALMYHGQFMHLTLLLWLNMFCLLLMIIEKKISNGYTVFPFLTRREAEMNFEYTCYQFCIE